MSSLCQSIISHGASGTLIDIECNTTNNLPTILIVGFANKTVNEAKDRLRGAFASCKLQLPRKRITINLAPADLPKTESCLDLAMAAAILACNTPEIIPKAAFVGELGLDGSVRPIRGLVGKLLHARSAGLCSFFVPKANLEQGRLVPGITLYPVGTLHELHDHLSGTLLIEPVHTGNGHHAQRLSTIPDTNLDDIAGQALAKRALMIAAAGGHNVLLTGPPGTGKSLLAKALHQLLPPMSHEEMLEVTHLNSLVSAQYDRLQTERPLRSPHHSASFSSVIGGGQYSRPGEVCLSHRGVLLLDEFPEFNRLTLESLRQPLEDGEVTVTRAKDSHRYPANFMLVATANPCPCGYNGFSTDRCKCTEPLIRRYQSRLSGPILDRIDLCCDVYQIDHKKLLGCAPQGENHATVLQRIAQARQVQAARYGSNTVLNSDLNNKQLRQWSQLNRPALVTLQDAAHRLQLSARGYMRTVKVARTIADLESSKLICKAHITEALTYRQRATT